MQSLNHGSYSSHFYANNVYCLDNFIRRFQYICDHNSRKPEYILVTFTPDKGVKALCKWAIYYYLVCRSVPRVQD